MARTMSDFAEGTRVSDHLGLLVVTMTFPLALNVQAYYRGSPASA